MAPATRNHLESRANSSGSTASSLGNSVGSLAGSPGISTEVAIILVVLSILLCILGLVLGIRAQKKSEAKNQHAVADGFASFRTRQQALTLAARRDRDELHIGPAFEVAGTRKGDPDELHMGPTAYGGGAAPAVELPAQTPPLGQHQQHEQEMMQARRPRGQPRRPPWEMGQSKLYSGFATTPTSGLSPYEAALPPVRSPVDVNSPYGVPLLQAPSHLRGGSIGSMNEDQKLLKKPPKVLSRIFRSKNKRGEYEQVGERPMSHWPDR